ncbi:MAG: hypothetical protein AB7F39_06745 [Variibacter sp.]
MPEWRIRWKNGSHTPWQPIAEGFHKPPRDDQGEIEGVEFRLAGGPLAGGDLPRVPRIVTDRDQP